MGKFDIVKDRKGRKHLAPMTDEQRAYAALVIAFSKKTEEDFAKYQVLPDTIVWTKINSGTGSIGCSGKCEAFITPYSKGNEPAKPPARGKFSFTVKADVVEAGPRSNDSFNQEKFSVSDATITAL